MIILRSFSSRAQKARRKKFDLYMADASEEHVYVPEQMFEPSEEDRIRKGRKAIKTGKDDLGFSFEKPNRSHLKMDKGAYNINDSINKAKPGDIKNATSAFGTNPEAKERVAERLTRSGKTAGGMEESKEVFSKAEKLKRDARVGKAVELAGKNKGKIALATGGIIVAGVGAKKLADKKKKQKKDSNKKD